MKQQLLKRLSIACISLLTYTASSGQDIHFSQFYETSILRNPALTGVFNGDYKVGLMYRNQWSSISAPFQTAQANVETKIALGEETQDFIGVGILGLYDKVGSINLQTISGSLAVTYNKSLNEDHGTFVSVGIMGGYIQRSFDPGKMTFDEQYLGGKYDPANPTGENLPNPKISQIDFGAGVNFSTNSGADNKTNYSLGVAGYHLTSPDDNFFTDQGGVKKEFRWNVNAGTNWLINDQWSAQLQGNFALQGQYKETMVGGLVGRKNDANTSESSLVIYAGVFFRINDALIPVIKVDYEGLTFAVSYDMNMSKLKAATNLRGGYELSVFKTGLMQDSQKGKARTLCPRR